MGTSQWAMINEKYLEMNPINIESELSFRRNYPCPGAWHPRTDEIDRIPHPPPNLPLEGGGKVLPSLSEGGYGWGWGGLRISNEAGIQCFLKILDAPVSEYGAGSSGPA